MQNPSNRRVEKESTEVRNRSDMSYEDRAALALIKVVILHRRGAGALEVNEYGIDTLRWRRLKLGCTYSSPLTPFIIQCNLIVRLPWTHCQLKLVIFRVPIGFDMDR